MNDIKRFSCGDADAAALSDRIVNDPFMLSKHAAVNMDNISGLRRIRFQPLNDVGIFALGNKADVLTVVLFGNVQSELAREFACLRLGQAAKRKAQKVKLFLSGGKQKVALVAVQIHRTVHCALARFGGGPDIVSGHQHVGAERFCGFKQIVKLDGLVAGDARDRRFAGNVTVGEPVDHLFFEAVFIVQHIVRNVQALGNGARIVNILSGTTGAFAVNGGAMVIKLQCDPDDIIAFALHQSGYDGRIHTAGHSDDDTRIFRLSRQAEAVQHLLITWFDRIDMSLRTCCPIGRPVLVVHFNRTHLRQKRLKNNGFWCSRGNIDTLSYKAKVSEIFALLGKNCSIPTGQLLSIFDNLLKNNTIKTGLVLACSLMGACAQSGCWAMSGFKPDEVGSIVNVLAFLAGVLESRSGGATQTAQSTDGNGAKGTFADILKKSAAGDGDVAAGSGVFTGVTDQDALSAPGAGEPDASPEEASGIVQPFRPNGAPMNTDQDQAAANGPIPMLLSLREGLEAGDITLDDLERAFEQFKELEQAGQSPGQTGGQSDAPAISGPEGSPSLAPGPLGPRSLGTGSLGTGSVVPFSPNDGPVPNAGLSGVTPPGIRPADGDAAVTAFSAGQTQNADANALAGPRPSRGNPTFFGPERPQIEEPVPDEGADFVVTASRASPSGDGVTPSNGPPSGEAGNPVPANRDQDIVVPGPPDQHVLDSVGQSTAATNHTVPAIDGDGAPLPGPVGGQGALPAETGTARPPIAAPFDGDAGGQGPDSPVEPLAVPFSDRSGQGLIPDAKLPETGLPATDRPTVKPSVRSGEQMPGPLQDPPTEAVRPQASDLPVNPAADRTTAAKAPDATRQPPAWIDAIIDAAEQAGAAGDDLAIRGSAVKAEFVLPAEKGGAGGLQSESPIPGTLNRSVDRPAEAPRSTLFTDDSLRRLEDNPTGKPVASGPSGPQSLAKPDARPAGAPAGAVTLEIAETGPLVLPAETGGATPEPDDPLLLQTSGRADSHLTAIRPMTATQGGSQTSVPIEAVGLHIARMAQQKESRFEIRLHPSELGRIDVRLDINEQGEVKAHLIVERRETMDMLQRDSRELQRALNEAGLSTDQNSLNFSMKNQNGEGFADGAGSPQSLDSVAQRDENEPDGIAEAAARRAYVQSSDGALDISI